MDYTKGEWIVDPDYDWVRDDNGWIVANCTGHPNSKANAHLIAAAPRMYEALQDMLRWFGKYPELKPSLDSLDGVSITINDARQALAKVERKETQ